MYGVQGMNFSTTSKTECYRIRPCDPSQAVIPSMDRQANIWRVDVSDMRGVWKRTLPGLFTYAEAQQVANSDQTNNRSKRKRGPL